MGVILAAHNCTSYDMRILLQACAVVETVALVQSVVAGCTDTLPLLKKKVPRQKSHALGKLATSMQLSAKKIHLMQQMM